MKIFFWNEGNIKIFSDEGKLKEFITRIPAPKEMLKEILQMEGKGYQRKTWNIRNGGRATEMVIVWVNIINDSSHLCSLKYYEGGK